MVGVCPPKDIFLYLFSLTGFRFPIRDYFLGSDPANTGTREQKSEVIEEEDGRIGNTKCWYSFDLILKIDRLKNASYFNQSKLERHMTRLSY